MVKANVTLNLPLVSFGVEGETANWFRGTSRSQPYLIVSRSCGFALDTGFQRHDGAWPLVWPPHGLAHQLWSIRKNKGEDTVTILSLDNGMALDSTTDGAEGKTAVMWGHHGESQQRWIIKAAGGDSLGCTITSARTRLSLTMSGNAEPRWSPWMSKGDDWDHQWLILPVSLPRFA